MATPSSYTEQDIKDIENWMEKHPEAWYWTTQEGLRIPMKFIKDDHLKNIKKHIDKYHRNFPDDLHTMIRKELKKRLTKTAAGKVLFG